MWKRGTVEAIYEWNPDWHRARIRLPVGKTFCEITRFDHKWVLRGPPRPHPLYREAALPCEGVVAVCEGEKACDAGWSIGLPCVTSGAANSAGLAAWSTLRGRDVIILPDRDAPGQRYAAEVAELLTALTPPANVKVVVLPELGDGDDLYDFVNEYRDSRDGDDIRTEILALAAATPQWSESPGSTDGLGNEWPDPQPLPDGLPPVLPFDFELLPESLRPWIRDIADRTQCPPDFPAVAAIVVLAAVVGRKIGILPKRHDNWIVVPNLWAAAIGPPSVMKTPAIQESLKPLKRLEIEAKKAHDEALHEFAAKQIVAEQRTKLARSAVKQALESGTGDALAAAREAAQGDTSPPVRRRYLVNDSTVERFGELLNQNPNGVLVYRDELIGLLKSLDKDGQEGARSFYLEAWNGTCRFTYDRIGRGTIDIEAAIVSIIGTIQPGPLRAYLHAAVSNGVGADGLIQRFQLAVYPDVSRTWNNVDRRPDTKAKNRAFDIIEILDQLNPADVGAVAGDDDNDGIPCLRFTLEAQDRFDLWRSELEHRLRSGDEHPVVEAHLAKFRSLIPSLALLFHLADQHPGAVGLESLNRAIAWERYLESHARRIYFSAVAPNIVEALALARKILARKLPDNFALRDIYRNNWIGLGTREAALRAVEVLLDLDWLDQIEVPTRGRTRTRFRINPRVRVARADADSRPGHAADPPLLSVLSVPEGRGR